MDIESPHWEEWEEKFTALAQHAQIVKVAPNISGSRHFLCLYGDNGLTPEEEFSELEKMSQLQKDLKKVEIDTSYWQDTVLFVP
jgi:hypothetical protein